jgi:exodeoxyribonuclease VII large subunit
VRRLVDDLALRLASGLSGRTRLAAERLARTGDRLHAGVDAVLHLRRTQADRLGFQLDALSPLKVLGRGYAVPVAPDGRVLRGRADFVPGSPFHLRVSDGEVKARVE